MRSVERMESPCFISRFVPCTTFSSPCIGPKSKKYEADGADCKAQAVCIAKTILFLAWIFLWVSFISFQSDILVYHVWLGLFVRGKSCRNADVVTRRQYVDLVESVKANGGEALIFSSMHISGDRKWTLAHPRQKQISKNSPHIVRQITH